MMGESNKEFVHFFLKCLENLFVYCAFLNFCLTIVSKSKEEKGNT